MAPRTQPRETTLEILANEPTREPEAPLGVSQMALSPDRLLEQNGVYRSPTNGQLVRDVWISTGRTRVNEQGKTVVILEQHQRSVAPPGMSIEEARERSLDFLDPFLGWIRYGRKREIEHPDNLGTQERRRKQREMVLDTDGEPLDDSFESMPQSEEPTSQGE